MGNGLKAPPLIFCQRQVLASILVRDTIMSKLKKKGFSPKWLI